MPTPTLNSAAPGDLAVTLLSLEQDAVFKLHALKVAGRDGLSLGSDQASITSDPQQIARDLSANLASLGDELQRGHAIACATAVDLEQPLEQWRAAEATDLDARAWLSFGRQLARSKPEDWKCIAVAKSRVAGQFTKLYLRLADSAWWSFQTQLDRPSRGFVDAQRRRLARRRSNSARDESMRNIAARADSAEGRALRRALKAIRARIGVN